ncbi:MAG: glycosyltransferase [Thermodesulfobacteriota bacterium]
MDFLVFSDDFGEHPSSCQHLFRHIAQQHRVLWVNTIGMRAPRPTIKDARKALRKIGKMVGWDHLALPSEHMPSALTVVQPGMLPYANLHLVRRLNSHSVIRTVRHKLHSLEMHDPIFVTTVPNACDYIGAFGEQRVVYYCVDDFAHWPGHTAEYISALETALLDRCDICIATSKALYDRFKQGRYASHLLTHGVDVRHFAALPEREHPALKHIPSPRVGYCGLIDERLDQGLVAAIARALPHTAFVFTGSVVTNVRELERLDNVYFTGPVPYTELPAMMAGWVVCMLPYKLDTLAQSINPLKLKEYIATGKPVLSTPLPAAQELEAHLDLGQDAAAWSGLLRERLFAPHSTGRRREVGGWLWNEGWGEKAQTFLSFVARAA